MIEIIIKHRIILIIVIFVVIVLYYYFKNKSRLLNIEANPKKGFNFNYYLYIPKNIDKHKIKYLLVEPNNAGRVSDEHEEHDKDALRLIKIGKTRKIADKLKLPLLVPVFDRPRSEWRMYTHALDRDTLMKNNGKFARIDLQLNSMIYDAQKRLKKMKMMVDDKVLLNGFSASGSFVNRYTVLHPNKVKAVASGGINCMPILPVPTLEGKNLIYPIGVYDIKDIADIEFNIDDYKKVPQYIYMGNLDDNDTLHYDDAFNDEERQLIIKILSEDMIRRWKKSKLVYKQLDVNAQMIMYEGVRHEVNNKMLDDLVDFFKDNIN